jgi:glutamate racemase
MEPAVKPAANATRTGHIGVLATEGTFQGDLFNHTADTHARHVNVHRQVAHGLVSLVEAGELSGNRAEKLLREYLDPMLAQGIDQLVLGCTHYPFLIPAMEKIVGNQVEIIDPADAVAKQVHRILAQGDIAADTQNSPQHRFFSTGDGDILKNILQQIDMPFSGVELLAWRNGVLDL